ncbi:hypothetical protein BTA51_04735 [Hahella sp. CCB-MM4]|uniref:hypothetical protein n=1 Tax=Hahella sp. (strain CCB-MM4) TaxID=1926491 RepID=UPI000B9BF431|nr:hypothetical protein [Hahella sp. CCB-MM4]OZG74321.1 hypothetical protein BTA51_04735 [Hahella sp. CCB-MM4]
MATDTESLSYQLMEEMEKLQASVSASFLKTNTLLERYGLSRELLGPLISKYRPQLPDSVLAKLEKRDREWRDELEQELNGNSNQQFTSPRNRLLRIKLLEHI